MVNKYCFVIVVLCGLCGLVIGAVPKAPVDVPFQKNYNPSWSADHIKYINGGSEVHLVLDKYSGTGFQSRDSYLFGHFSMRIKLVGGDSAGVVTAFYLSSQNSEHDEIDFEFLGNRTGQPYIVQTNVFTGGQGNREQRIYLWFDPTQAYHSYSVLWNMYHIAFFVDNVPIRIFKNSKDLGVRFPFNQPMKIYSSLWNADDWATRGGLEKTDWSKAPFIASYTSFHVDGCDATTPQSAQVCSTTGMKWWDQKAFQDLDGLQYRRLGWVRKKYTIYNYCTDRSRYTTVPPECELSESRSELLTRIQGLKQDLQSWRSKLDTQVKVYRDVSTQTTTSLFTSCRCSNAFLELSDLKKSLNVEVEQMRSEFQELRTTLQQQQDDVTSKLKDLGLQDVSEETPSDKAEGNDAEAQFPSPGENDKEIPNDEGHGKQNKNLNEMLASRYWIKASPGKGV
ncbi:hypothetical protein IFM89_018131 [Coptis chinensis]|uniref:xyloglucan:xyloglucosyl transferase n=1 Tax=Coptis chinensis TaxID=261450 RepID=A0A835HRN2_9MAGN|nr:hypothetical protein IFM89_018131 [Coptis chinensis]